MHVAGECITTTTTTAAKAANTSLTSIQGLLLQHTLSVSHPSLSQILQRRVQASKKKKSKR